MNHPRLLRRLVAAGLALVLVPLGLDAQETGTVTGQVTDATTGEALVGVQIFVRTVNVGGLTNDQGRFLLQNVPPGERQVSAISLGYAQATQVVDVQAGESAVVDFALSQSAIALDEVVVTATGEQRKRELGNAVATIQTPELTEVAPVTNMSTLLQGRSAGVQVFGSSGTPGMGSRIRIRGSGSLSLSNEPLVYVDGVRVQSGAAEPYGVYTGGQEPSRLDDINPEDIESVEIVKGPAAASLYGTEAANGVVRITTKRGTSGDTRWNMWLEGGLTQEPNEYPLNWAGLDSGSENYGQFCALGFEVLGLCSQDGLSSYQILEDPEFAPFEDGSRRQLGMSVSGGSDLVNYYVSAEFENEIGPYKLPARDREVLQDRGIRIDDHVERPQDYERLSLRANLQTRLAEDATVTLKTGYISSDLSYTGNDNNSFGFLPSGFFGGAIPEDGYDGGWGFQAPAELFGRSLFQDAERFTTSANLAWQPFTFLDVRVTTGLDFTSQKDEDWIPRGLGVPGSSNLGDKTTSFTEYFNYTFDASSSASFDLTDRISSRTSAGVQYYQDITHGAYSNGEDLPPGAGSIQTAANTEASEYHIENKTAGVFVQQQFGYNDRLFVTGAMRADDNSAFGKDFDIITYPKVSASWLASEETFFPDIPTLDRFRLRAAWGKSGLQPGSTDALRLLEANAITGPDDRTTVGVAVDELGNAVLEPEQSSEVEAGFDADFFESRMGVELTYYKTTTAQALVEAELAPSLGADLDRWVNVAEVENRGWELGVNATVLDRSWLRWDLNVSGSVHSNELLDLGENEPIGTTWRHVEGFPLGGVWSRPIESYSDENGDGIIFSDEIEVGDTAVYIGPGLPQRDLAINTTITFLERFHVYALLDHRGDYFAHNLTEEFRCRFLVCRGLVDRSASAFEQARAHAAVFHGSQTDYGFMEKADFWKLREVSVTYDVPSTFSGRWLKADRARVTLTGRNLATWTDYSGMDPEIDEEGVDTNFGIQEFLTQPPIRYWTVRVNLSF